MKKAIEFRFWFADLVYLKVDPEAPHGMVTSIGIRPGGVVTYGVTWPSGESIHYDFELTTERTFET